MNLPKHNSLHIGMVAPTIETGVATHLMEIIPRLTMKGHKVTLVTGSKYEKTLDTTTKAYELWNFPTPFYAFAPSSIFDLSEISRQMDVLHIHGYPQFFTDYLTVTRPLHKTPIIITFHGSLSVASSLTNRGLKELHNSIMMRFDGFVDRFIAVSYAERDDVARKGIPQRNVEVIYNGVSNKYAELKRKRKEKLSGGKILFMGRLTSVKNVDLLVRAMPYIIEQNNEARLILAGPDWGKREELENLASDLNIEECITFTGEAKENEKAELLASCDVYVSPSLLDVFSLSLIEASATGLPIVAFNVGATSEMVVDGKTGIIVNDITPKALAKAIIEILINRDLAFGMGQEGRRYVMEKFSWEKTVDQLEKVYWGALERGKRRT
ncbi:MAG: glycosyltransferase family 4 protein [Candidatus Heimdallarchaeota archaeon]